MIASYKRLWKLLIDRDMMKRELCAQAHISPTTMAKLGKGENVGVDILLRICGVLNCGIDDIMEVLPDESENSKKD
jgi:DNA-binding Xre family transcriptional regulator